MTLCKTHDTRHRTHDTYEIKDTRHITLGTGQTKYDMSYKTHETIHRTHDTYEAQDTGHITLGTGHMI